MRATYKPIDPYVSLMLADLGLTKEEADAYTAATQPRLEQKAGTPSSNLHAPPAPTAAC